MYTVSFLSIYNALSYNKKFQNCKYFRESGFVLDHKLQGLVQQSGKDVAKMIVAEEEDQLVLVFFSQEAERAGSRTVYYISRLQPPKYSTIWPNSSTS